MDNISLIVATAALACSTWVYFQAKRKSRESVDRMRAMEDRIRSRFSEDELAYFDRHFESRGIAR